MKETLRILERLYDARAASQCEQDIERALLSVGGRLPTGRPGGFSEADAVLIAYPDMLRGGTSSPIEELRRFCVDHLSGAISIVHLLPFFPSSSDEGFAVVDHRSVARSLGTWEDIARLRTDFRLMVDAVFNHVSAGSPWFRAFLAGDPEAQKVFITVPPGFDLSKVVRPRATPLLTPFLTPQGRRLVWTTFGPDQVDLDFSHPQVLVRVLRTLLTLVRRGADLVRLDAIGYVWKESGTSCIHLPPAHLIVQLFRAVLDAVAPRVALITETNSPHRENVSYFGDGSNEAQLVYNFTLPPLVLHAFLTQDAGHLSDWARGLAAPSPRTTFLNFLGSHDGIGLMPLRDILPEVAVDLLVQATLSRGGRVSRRAVAGQPLSPYELNISYWDALVDPRRGETLDVLVARFLCAHAIMMTLPGVPALYFHSLVGSVGWPEGPELTGSNRSINRDRPERGPLEAELRDPLTRRARVHGGMVRLLSARRSSRAFHPAGGHRVLSAGPGVFAVLRSDPRDESRRVLCLHNVTETPQDVGPRVAESLGPAPAGIRDLVTGLGVQGGRIRLAPFQVSWLCAADGVEAGQAGAAVRSAT